MPWNPELYPENWGEIAVAVKKAAGWCCERCGRLHDPSAGYTLTVHHLDGDPSNCEESNLVALCQRCHLHVQAKLLPGQMMLPGMEEEWLIKRSEMRR